MFRIAICDDDEGVCSELENIIFQFAKTKVIRIEIEVYYTGEELCDFMRRGKEFDVIFLDIELPSLNGVEVGRYIRDVMKNDLVQIVYVSGKEDYYLELFEIRPMHFLQKPLVKEKVEKDIEKAMYLLGILGRTFSYNQGHIKHKVQIKEILYFESNSRKIQMVLQDQRISFYGKLSQVHKELEKYQFLYIHKSYIVNYAKVIEFGSKYLKMTNSDLLPISRNKSKSVLDLQLKYELRRMNE